MPKHSGEVLVYRNFSKCNGNISLAIAYAESFQPIHQVLSQGIYCSRRSTRGTRRTRRSKATKCRGDKCTAAGGWGKQYFSHLFPPVCCSVVTPETTRDTTYSSNASRCNSTIMPRRRKAPQLRSAGDLTEPTEEELLAQLEHATNNDGGLNFSPNFQGHPHPTATATATTASTEQNTPVRTKRKYTKNSGVYPRPQEFDENGNPIIPGYEYAALSLTGPRRRPPKPPTPPPSLDPNGQPWLYPKKTRQGEGSNLAPFSDEIKQWIEDGQSSRDIAEILIARGVETSDRHVAKQRLKMGFRQRARRKLTTEAVTNMRKAKQSVAKPLPTKGDVSVRRVRIRDMRQAEITRLTKEGLSAQEIADNLSSRGINMRSGAPTVIRLQKKWGLIEGGNDLQSLRTSARHESTRRQKEQLTNAAQELGITDIDDWVKRKMKEPEMMDARRRFAYELMGDAKPAIAVAGIEAAVARARRARNKRIFLQKLAQAGNSESAAGNPSAQDMDLMAGQASLTPSVSQSESPAVIDVTGQDGESDNDGEDDENGETEAEDTGNTEEEDDENEGEEGEEEGTDAASSRAQQPSEPMEVDTPNPYAQQPAHPPFQPIEQNSFATQVANDQHHPSEGFSQARLVPPPTNSRRSAFVSIAPRPEYMPHSAPQQATLPPRRAPQKATLPPRRALQKATLPRSKSSRPQVSDQNLQSLQPTPIYSDPPPVSHLDAPASETVAPSHYWQPSRGQADFMAQQYGLFPFHTPSPKQHTYSTVCGLVITMGFEYLAAPPTPDAPMIMVPKAYIPPELQAHAPARPQLNGWGKAPKYPPVVVPSVPVPPMAIPAEEAERHKRDQKILEKIQKVSEECAKMMAARANNRLLENSLTGLPPSRYDIQNAKKKIKEAADALFAAG